MKDPHDGHDKPSGDTSNADSSEFLPAWSSLAVLLAIFFLISVISLLTILQGGSNDLAAAALNTRAFGPADFAEIEWDAPLLPAVVAAIEQDGAGSYTVPPPPFSEEGIFPCTDCHADLEVDPEPRELGFHEDIELNHGPAERWCLDCHSAEDRDRLRLATGGEIGFDESYKLCGQCHGTIFRDWRAGIHGRRRGYWNAAKSYMLCAHCHDPHSPKFEPMEPLPPPVRPQFLSQADREAAP